MGNGGSDQSSLLPISGVLALLAIFGVAIFSQQPLKGIRPGIGKIGGTTGKVAARLWQDPFRAVMDTKPSAQQAEKIEEGVLNNATILAVMVPGAPYAEESELRLRWRYAVLAGLRRLGYTPEDAEHIAYVSYSPGSDSSKNGDAKIGRGIGMADIIPFERLVRRRKKEDAVLLIWMNEDLLSTQDNPKNDLLGNMNALFTRIGIVGKSVKIIGPSDSTTLRAFVSAMKDGVTRLQNEYRIFSATPTIENLYLPGPDDNLIYRNDGRFQVIRSSDGKIRITRTIKADNVLTDKLVRELSRRRCFADKGRVAIISEWDTYYGRHISDTFENSLYAARSDFSASDFDSPAAAAKLRLAIAGNLRGNARKPASAGDKMGDIEWLNRRLHTVNLYDQMADNAVKDSKIPWQIRLLKKQTESYGHKKYSELGPEESKNVRILNRMLIENFYDGLSPKVSRLLSRFSYLRGIDGQVPGEEPKEEEKSDSKDKKYIAEIITAGMSEQAVGKSQYDYLRRLADKIYDIDRQLKLKGGKGITAIGVLGTDFYDKYLILQALRQRLPGCVYFTTELDARYLQADNNKWTRNLIIASHFGFELRGEDGGDLQEDVPPFRDAYQTSIFYATLKAIAGPAEFTKSARADTSPRLYEIGRRHAVDLNTYNRRASSFVEAEWWKILGFLVFSLLLAAFSSLHLQSFIGQGCASISATAGRCTKRWKIMLPVYLLVLVACGILSYGPGSAIFWNLTNEEPFSLFEGVSVWPTEILRMAVIFLSIVFIARIYNLMRKNQAELSHGYAMGTCMPEEPHDASITLIKPLHSLKSAWDLRRYNFATFSGKVYRADGIGLCQIWTEYLRFGDCRSRVLRVFISCLLFTAVAFMLMTIFGLPQTPARGTCTYVSDKAILVGAVASFLFLTFLVVDTTRLCAYFVRALTAAGPLWQKKSLARHLSPAGREAYEDIYGEWMLVDFVARHTNVIQKFILYPVIVWVVFFFSRSQFFDNWQTPVSLMAVITLSAVFAWSCVFRLRKAAEDFRTSVKKRLAGMLDEEVFRTKPAAGDKKGGDRAEQIKHVMKNVEDIRVGAFAPFSRNPLVHSALVALGGIGGTSLLQYLNFLNM